VDMGYTMYRWDIFDVAKSCDCPLDKVGCQSEEVCFREDHIEKYNDPETGEEKERVLHKAYCGGRAKYAQGHIPMTTILSGWKRINRNHSQWEVESMGSRPTASGFVIKDQTKFAANLIKKHPQDLYISGFAASVVVDWGTTAAGLEVWQEQVTPAGRQKHVMLECDQIEEAGINQIIGAVVGYIAKYRESFIEVAADIGGGGNYLNPYLRDMGYQVRDVNFNQEKEAAVAAWNIYNEGEGIVVPSEFDLFSTQVRGWKRNKMGKIDKGNDHLCDAAVCYFSKFIEQMGLSHIRAIPVTFNTGGSGERSSSGNAHRTPDVGMTPRVAAARGFGGRRR
jgi:hypothetical protein